MHQARGPYAATIPFAPIAPKSVPFLLNGKLFEVHGPSRTPPPDTHLSVPTDDGRAYHFVALEPVSRV